MEWSARLDAACTQLAQLEAERISGFSSEKSESLTEAQRVTRRLITRMRVAVAIERKRRGPQRRPLRQTKARSRATGRRVRASRTSRGSPGRQAEVIGPIWEHRSLAAPIEIEAGAEIPTRAVRHDLAVVMTPDCDLLWDFEARFETDDARAGYSPESPSIDGLAVAVPHVLLCEAYAYDDARTRVKESRLFKLIEVNRDERYHHFPTALIGEGGQSLNDLYLDFKKPLAVPTSQLYDGVRLGGVSRVAWIPPVWRHDLIHRFYGFMSRVATPAP